MGPQVFTCEYGAGPSGPKPFYCSADSLLGGRAEINYGEGWESVILARRGCQPPFCCNPSHPPPPPFNVEKEGCFSGNIGYNLPSFGNQPQDQGLRTLLFCPIGKLPIWVGLPYGK
jgi:hypothetical protein